MLRSPSLLAVVLASLASVACSAETAPSDPSALRDDAAEASEARTARDILPLSGEAGVAVKVGLDAPHAQEAGAALASSPVATLLVKETGVKYEVLAFELGIEGSGGEAPTSGATRTADTKLAPVKLRVRATNGAPSFGSALLAGRRFETLHLNPTSGVVDPKAPFAVFEKSLVTKASFEATEDGNVEVVELQVLAESIQSGKARVRFDAMTARTTCEGECACGEGGSANELGPFTQAPSASWPVQPTSTPIESVRVVISKSTAPTSATSDVSASVTKLDDHTITGMFGAAGLCAMWQVGMGAVAPRLTVDVASALSAVLVKPVTESRFEACRTMTKRVRFASAPSGTRQEITSNAAGIVRTDYALDGMGKITSKQVSGWSFVRNVAITDCSEAF